MNVTSLPMLPDWNHDHMLVVFTGLERPDLANILGGRHEHVERLAARAKFDGKSGTMKSIPLLDDGFPGEVVFVGVGNDAGHKSIEKAAVKLAAGDMLKKAGNVVVVLANDLSDKPNAHGALALGLMLGGYRFDIYRKEADRFTPPKSLSVLGLTTADLQKAEALYAGIKLARDLVNEPANILTPPEFAKRASKLADLGIDIEVLGEKQMADLGMGALLGVGQGSELESQLVVMKWLKGGEEAPLAFVGKGVCFDTGGISIKPASGMEEMTMDMGGAAAVTGAMHAIATSDLACNVIGVIGLVENMPDGRAQRPGDVVTSMSGQTIEVLNTDAEGRLVLCDAITFTKDRFQPSAIIDLATLTGAILVSLGHEYAGLFSNNDDLVARLNTASEQSGDRVWRFPLTEKFDSMLRSRVADMANIGGRWAGSITAAQFLQRFVGDTPWAHLDIAGTAYVKEPHDQGPKGATGYGVRLLVDLAAGKK